VTNYDATLTNFVAGDDFTIERTVTSLVSGVVLERVWFTVKRKLSQADIDAVIQKEITTINVNGTGYIDDTDHFYIYLTTADTVLLTPYSSYYYDIQLQLSDTTITTPEYGTIIALPQVTRATS
jgi:hypothetical protein